MRQSFNVLLVGAEDEENLAIRYLGAALRREGYMVTICGCSREQHIPAALAAVQRLKPRLVGISIAFQSMSRLYFRLASEIKGCYPDSHITVGGHFPTFEFKRILETQEVIDSVIRYEGEAAISALATCLANGESLVRVPNLVWRTATGILLNEGTTSFPDLDTLPHPLRSKRPRIRLGERFSTLVSSRGCYHSSCLYCCIGAFHKGKRGKKYALRGTADIAREIAELYHRDGVRVFQFHDDNFTTGSREETAVRLRSLKHEIESCGVDIKKVAFLIKARPDSIDDDVALACAELGIVGVFLGVENASASGLKALIRNTRVSDITSAIDILERRGIAVTFNLLIFHPTARLDEINENIVFMNAHNGHPVDFGRAEIVAGSPLEAQARQEGLVKGSWPAWDYTLKDCAVSRLFTLNLMTFRREGSPYTHMIHGLIALTYHAHTVRRLYPGRVSEGFFSEAKELVIAANRMILNHLMAIYDLSTVDCAEDKIGLLYAGLARDCTRFIHATNTLTGRMQRLQSLERHFGRWGVQSRVQDGGLTSRVFGLVS